MAAPFRLDGWTFSSSAFDVLGDVAGYNAHEARGRWARAGSEATERQSYVFSEAAIRGLFGPRGVEALLASELAERVDGGLRMLRMDGSIEWYEDIASKRRRAGQERARNAVRDERGRLVKSSTTSTPPAHAGVLDQQTASSTPAESSSLVPDLVSDRISETHTRVRERHPAVGRIALRVLGHAGKLRGELIALKLRPPPFGVQPDASSDPGAAALMDRIGELLVEVNEAEAERIATNRVDVAFAKARADGDAQWFSPIGMFTQNSFATWAHLTPDQVARKPARGMRGNTGAIGSASPRSDFGEDSKPAKEAF